MELFRQLVPYAAAALAIGVGLASVTAPPIFTLDRDLAVALIVGGFGGAGVSVIVPNVVRTARSAAIQDEAQARRARAIRARGGTGLRSASQLKPGEREGGDA
jgi:hypothetical protein